MKKPILNEKFADNGEHSHWELIDANTGEVLWEEIDTVLPQADVIKSVCKHEGGKMRGELYNYQICIKCGEEY